jgi:hypothetical protein
MPILRPACCALDSPLCCSAPVVLNRMVAPASEIAPFVDDHLAYMNKLRLKGICGHPGRSSKRQSSLATG